MAIDINDAETVDVGETYVNGDMLIKVIAKSVKYDNSDILVELAEVATYDIETDTCIETYWTVLKTDKAGTPGDSDNYDSSEEAYIAYVECAFGINV